MRVESRYLQSGEADKYPLCAEFHGIQSKAMLAKMTFNAIRQEVAFHSIQTTGHKLHHARVGVQAGEGLPVAWFPAPQQEAVGFDHRIKH
jgi:hypothetical protein